MKSIAFLLVLARILGALGQPAEELPLTVHVVTHSHLDAGWVYDVDRCFETVDHIFSSVFESLKQDRARSYTVGDIYFFRRWYETILSQEEQLQVKRLVADKQLEFVHGGSVSTDEANVSFNDLDV